MGANLPNWIGAIESLTHEGVGVGTRLEGRFRRPIFVPGTAPGDRVEAKILKTKGKYAWGELVQILTPSPDRVAPRCPHYGVCGGCNLQHLRYEAQLVQKAQQIAHLFSRAGVALSHDVRVLPARRLHKYRWRSRIAVEFKDGLVRAGFRKARSNEIVPIQTCHIVAPEIRELIQLLNAQQHTYPEGEFEIIAAAADKRKAAIFVRLDDIDPQLRGAAREFLTELYANNRTLMGNLFLQENRTTRTIGQVQEHLTYKADGLEFFFLPETFIQANIPTNDLLVRTVLELLSPQPHDIIVDLYAGLGNFSLPIAKRSQSVIAVEGNEASILAGKTNALRNRIDNVTFVHRSVEKYLWEYLRREQHARVHYPDASAFVLDPPRAGCSEEVIKHLRKIAPKRICYISCNPQTLAADCATLAPQYRVAGIIGVDMFPDISHVEVVALLERHS